jgi:septum formation protein
VKNNQALILASSSPRRLALLEQVHIIPDQIISPDIDETPEEGEIPKNLVKRLAIEKALMVSENNKDSFILAGDTIVVCGRKIIGKAENEKELKNHLRLLSGRRHKVLSGIAVVDPNGNVRSKVCETIIKFKRLTRKEVQEYIQSKEWENKAGGYGIQGYADCFIKFIRGSYSNVVGLPLYDTMQLLKSSGFKKG